MKRFSMNWLYICLLAVASFGFVACSDDDEEPTLVTPVFPEKTTASYTAGTSHDYSFTANVDWRLASNATWCTLAKADGTEGQDIEGTAGAQTITIKISDEGQEVGKVSTAVLTMYMGTENAVVAEITRAGKEYAISIKKIVTDDSGNEVEGDEVDKIEIVYGNESKYKVDANFEFAARSNDDKIEITRSSTDANVISVQLASNAEIRYAFNGTITIYNEQGDANFDYTAEYAGMDPNVIDIEPSTTWNAIFTADGSTYTVTSGLTGTTEQHDAPYTFQLTAFNDEYEIVYVLEDEWGCMRYEYAGMRNWFNVSEVGDAKGHLQLIIDENTTTESRKGYVMAFPKAIYDSSIENFESEYLEQDENGIDQLNTAAEKYVVIGFTQKGLESADNAVKFSFTYSLYDPETGDASSIPYPSEEIMSYDSQFGEGSAMTKYGTSNVWCAMLDSSYFPKCEQFFIHLEGLKGMIWTVNSSISNTWGSDIEVTWNDSSSFVMYGLNYLESTPTQEMEVTFTDSEEGVIGVLIFGAY